MKKTIKVVSILCAALLCSGFGFLPVIAQTVKPGNMTSNQVDREVDALMNRMTLKEKIQLLGGTGFTSQPIPRLGIPALRMNDGALGVRWGKATAWPCGTSMAASWDTSLVYQIGRAIGQEVRGKGNNVLLGPNVNIARNPLNGRTFEAFGEDPYLTSEMAVNYIEGVQSEGVAATVKHFVANTQELGRLYISSQIGQRALHEIYFPAFKAAVQRGHTLAVMSAYNRLNGIYASEDSFLLNNVLRGQWGFRYLTMSDWGAVHSTMPTETSGQDLEMPTGQYLNYESILPMVKSGKLSIGVIDTQVRHILRVIVRLGLLQNPSHPDSSLINTPANRVLARKAAHEGIVLLENHERILPLNFQKIHTITVVGTAAKHVLTGGGSAMVTPYSEVTSWAALNKRVANKVKMTYVPGVILDGDAPAISAGNLRVSDSPGSRHGLKGEYFSNKTFTGKPVYQHIDQSVNYGLGVGDDPFGVNVSDVIPKAENLFENGYAMRWTGYLTVPQSGTYVIDVVSNNGVRLYFDGKEVLSSKLNYGIGVHSYSTRMSAKKLYPIKLEYYQRCCGVNIRLAMHRSNDVLIRQAGRAVRKSDIVLAFVGDTKYDEAEGHDRQSLHLVSDQDKLLETITAENRHTVVIVSSGGPVVMNPWKNNAAAILQAWFAGEQTGNAIVDVLTGVYNPSGRLPLTFPVKWTDAPASKTYATQDSVAPHQEGIFVGYRYYDKYDVKPLYPFGYGLSYTTFSFSGLTVHQAGNDITVTFTVTNTGRYDGVETAQVYVHANESAMSRTVRSLKGFARVSLKAGASSLVTIHLQRQQFAYYNTTDQSWVVEPGTYDIEVGSSSRSLPLSEAVMLK